MRSAGGARTSAVPSLTAEKREDPHLLRDTPRGTACPLSQGPGPLFDPVPLRSSRYQGGPPAWTLSVMKLLETKLGITAGLQGKRH